MTCASADGDRYERWRAQWLAGTDSQAHATLRLHGVARTLALTAPLRPAAGPSPPRATAAEAAGVALAEAARQIRRVLRAGREGGCRHA